MHPYGVRDEVGLPGGTASIFVRPHSEEAVRDRVESGIGVNLARYPLVHRKRMMSKIDWSYHRPG